MRCQNGERAIPINMEVKSTAELSGKDLKLAIMSCCGAGENNTLCEKELASKDSRSMSI